MANFAPLKNRFLLELDESLRGFRESGHFLDFGCGSADVAAHMLKSKQWTGDLMEVDETSRKQIKDNPLFENSKLYATMEELPEASYDLILMFDVLEHLPEPENILKNLYRKLKPGGLLALIIPYRQSTWGWDDDFYGHLRRWSRQELLKALQGESFQIIQMSDPTYPLYRFLRWYKLKTQSKAATGLYEGENFSETMSTRSEQSPHSKAWEDPPAWIQYLPWNLMNKMTLPFNQVFEGDEIYALAMKEADPSPCDHCENEEFTYLEHYDHHVLELCPNCHNRRLRELS
jgi:SAM-dependent methyltransferase